jgi:Zinc knuckle
VRDFQRDLETLAVRFPDVTERQVRQIFWTGIRSHLRLHLIEKGLNPERSSIQKLVKYASRREAARKTLKRERKGSSYNPSPRVFSSGAPSDEESSSSADEAENIPDSRVEAGSVASTVDPSEEHKEEERATQFRNLDFLPQEEYIRLRQEGRCFKCKNKGHLSRNCPEIEPSPPVEVLAARFADKADPDESSEENESEYDETQSSEDAALNDEDNDEGSYSSEENSDDNYSDSSNEYYVGALRIDLRSDRGHRLEGGRLWSRLRKQGWEEFDAEVQRWKVCESKP